MPQSCKCCQFGQKIVKQLEQDFLNGMNKHRLSKKYEVSYDSITFHLDNHLTVKMAKGAELKSAQDGFNLLQKIDELYDWMKIIFQRNFDKEKDGMALKALSQQRNTLELLAKISYTLHQNKLLEIEQEKNELLNVDIPLERLTEKEKDLYFQLNQKLLGERDAIDMSGFTNFEEVREVKEKNKPKKIIRTKFQPDKLEPEVTTTTTKDNEDSDDKEIRFRPIVEQPPPKSNRNRRDFAYFMRKKNPPQYGSKIHPAFIPFGEGE